LVADDRAGISPFQSYRLAGENGRFLVGLDILGSKDPNGPKTVRLNLLRLNKTMRISMSTLKRFASLNFRSLPPSPFLGFAFTRLAGPENPIVGVSAPTGDCVNGIGLFYDALYSSPWGH
jgi:hypothetical protein